MQSKGNDSFVGLRNSSCVFVVEIRVKGEQLIFGETLLDYRLKGRVAENQKGFLTAVDLLL
jgi:hypothetical protein